MPTAYYYQDVVEFGPNEPAPYTSKDVVIYLTGTTTLAPVYSDSGLTSAVANSKLTTNEFGELRFYSSASSIDLIRVVGGRRTTYSGEPLSSGSSSSGGSYARSFFLG